MITRPNIWETKYDNMSHSDAMLNYERDVMLYEQTIALQKLNENKNTNIPITEDRVIPWYIYGDDLYDIFECKVFKQNTPEYIEYEELRRKRNLILESANLLRYKVLVPALLLLIFSIVFLPICIAFIQDIYYMYKYIILSMVICIIVIYYRISVLTSKANKLKLQRDELVKEKYKGKKKRVR